MRSRARGAVLAGRLRRLHLCGAASAGRYVLLTTHVLWSGTGRIAARYGGSGRLLSYSGRGYATSGGGREPDMGAYAKGEAALVDALLLAK